MTIGLLLKGAADQFLPRTMPGTYEELYALILMILALALIFAGRSLVKVLAFIVVGFAGAAAGAVLGGMIIGAAGTILGAVIGFIVGGLIGLLIVHMGMGLALGYFGYLVTRDLSHIFLLSVVVGVILFLIGIILTNRILELGTVIVGGVILYGIITFFGLPPFAAILIAVVVAVAGFYVQRRRISTARPGPTASSRP